jgi:putative FmdB family regulatory protein
VDILPLYAYRCTQCGHKFEKIQNFSAEPESACPKCQGLLERPLTAPGLHFKGAGWYVNDYAGKSTAAADAVAPSESSSPAAAAPCASAAACPAASTCAAAPSTT